MRRLFLVIVFCSGYGLTNNKTTLSDNALSHQIPNFKNNIKIISYDNITRLPDANRNLSELIGNWKINGFYFGEYLKASSDNSQFITDPATTNGYSQNQGDITIKLNEDEIIPLRYAYIDSGTFQHSISSTDARTILLSNTSISMSDYNVSNALNNQSNNNNLFVSNYDGQEYPRYLYSYFFTIGFFAVYEATEWLTIWYSEDSLKQYRGLRNLPADSTVIFGNFINFDKKSIAFDSLEIKFIEYDGQSYVNMEDTLSFTFNGTFYPDSVYVPQDSVVSILDYYGNYNNLWNFPVPFFPIFQDIDWVFNEDSTGYEIRTQVADDPLSPLQVNFDTTNFYWLPNQDSVELYFEQRPDFFPYERPDLKLSVVLNVDTLILSSESVLCELDTCFQDPNSDLPFLGNYLFDSYTGIMEHALGLSNINYVFSDFGLSMRKFFENANLYFDYQNSSVDLSIYPMGMSLHQLSFVNIGTDTLFWSIEDVSDPWLIIEENSGSTAPGEREYIDMNIDGSALSGGNNYSTEIVIHSNDFNNSSLSIPVMIDVNDPNISFFYSPQNGIFSFLEDDTLEVLLYVRGPQGQYTFSVDGNSDNISGQIIIDDEFTPNSNFAVRAKLFVFPSTNWHGQADLHVRAENEFGYSTTDTLSFDVENVYDPVIPAEMIYPPNGEFIFFYSLSDSIRFLWSEGTYIENDIGPDIEYRLRLIQSNASGNVIYEFDNLIDTTFVFYPDSTTFNGVNSNYNWTLYTINEDSTSGVFFLFLPSTSVETEIIPTDYKLHSAFPNPFNPTTSINYDLPKNEFVIINVFDLMGREVKTLVNKEQVAGFRSVKWDATNNLGQPVSAGMYIYTIQAGEFRQTKKMVLLK